MCICNPKTDIIATPLSKILISFVERLYTLLTTPIGIECLVKHRNIICFINRQMCHRQQMLKQERNNTTNRINTIYIFNCLMFVIVNQVITIQRSDFIPCFLLLIQIKMQGLINKCCRVEVKKRIHGMKLLK